MEQLPQAQAFPPDPQQSSTPPSRPFPSLLWASIPASKSLIQATAGALLQEHLDGTEYAVDTVSRDGVHRICAIWEHQKESSINGWVPRDVADA